MGGLRVAPAPVTPSTSGPNIGSDAGHLCGSSELSQFCPVPPKSWFPSFSMKRKLKEQSVSPTKRPKISLPRRPVKWQPPCSSRGRRGGEGEDRRANRNREEAEKDVEEVTIQAHACSVQSLAGVRRTDGQTRKQQTVHGPQHAARGSTLTHCEMKTTHTGDLDNDRASATIAATSKPPKLQRAKRCPRKTTHHRAHTVQSGAVRREPLTDQAAGVTSDPRVKDVGRMSLEEREWLLSRVGQARATVLTMVYQDGSTLLDPEQVSTPQGHGGGSGWCWLRGHASASILHRHQSQSASQLRKLN